jgi:hypothetical protein
MSDLPHTDTLGPEDRATLHRVVEAARDRQRAELQASIDAALEHVPRVLRGALRKVLFK